MDIAEIRIGSEQYPERLTHIHAPPETLYVAGELLPQDAVAIAIVGARKCTDYGRHVAYELGYGLAQRGVTVVSGMALGVDAEAHKGALDAGGRTIAVLGTGVDERSIYPHTHTSLAQAIMRSGAVISEYPPGTPAYPGNFPERNRIVAGLSLGVVVVEANERSGSLITARLALEQGRDVFAVPGSIYANTSRGTHRLIQEGAKLITCANDILEELEMEGAITCEHAAPETEEEGRILALLQQEPAHADRIIEVLGLPSHTVLALISMLELNEKIQHIGNNTYGIKE